MLYDICETFRIMEKLPKLLVTNLEELCNDEDLLYWNVNANNGIYTVSIKFGHGSHIVGTPGSIRKSPSKIRRNHYRSHMLSASQNKDNEESKTIEQLSKVGEFNLDEHLRDSLNHGDSAHAPNTTEGGHAISTSQVGHVHEQEHSACGTQNKSLSTMSESSHSSTSTEHCNTQVQDMSECKAITTTSSKDEVQEEQSIDPSKYFSKVIADFRRDVDCVTMRGLTWTGNIVTVKPEQDDDGLCVICPVSSYTDYAIQERYNKSYELIQTFYDQRYHDGWKTQVQWLCKRYKSYLNEKG